MKLRVLGSGGIHPDPTRGGPAYLVSQDDDHLLLEAGPGALRALSRAGLSSAALRGVCLTHRHPDHTSELGVLLELEKALGRRTPLALLGPAVLEELVQFWLTWARPEPAELPFALERHWLPGALRLGSFDLRGSSVPHVPDSLGFRIAAGGRTLVFGGDCGPGAEVVELARGADLLVLECSLPEGTTCGWHLNAAQAAELAAQAGCRRLVLSHLAPNVDPGRAEEICRARGLDARAAHDGLCLEV